MEIEDFVIPLKPENLEESAEGKYCVKSVLEIDALRSSDIFNFLEGTLHKNDALNLIQNIRN